MPNHKKNRTNEDIKREIAAIIRELKDPRLPSLVTVTAVNVTPDLKFAKVYVSVFGDKTVADNAMAALKAAAGFVRMQLSHRIKIRYTPEITFVFDNSIAFGAHISSVINEINKKNTKDNE